MPKYEFYRDDSGCFINKIYNLEDPQVKCFTELDSKEVYDLFDHLCRFREARKALVHLMEFYNGDRRKALRRFIECNWIGLDAKIDVTDEALNYEYIPCQHKGKNTCPLEGEGIVCQHSNITEEQPMLV